MGLESGIGYKKAERLRKIKGRTPVRQELAFRPRWAAIRPTAVRMARQNLWRVEPNYDLDDLIQEALIVFWKLTESYPNVATPQHFMSLFRNSFHNMILRLANRRTRIRQHEACVTVMGTVLGDSEDGPNLDPEDRRAQQDIAEAEYRMLLEDAPPDVREVVREMVERPDQESRKAPAPKQDRSGREETKSELLCRLVGDDPAVADLGDRIRRWIFGEPQCSP